MKDYTKGIRTYCHFGSAYYAAILRANGHNEFEDEVWFGLSHPEGGTMGEMAVKWTRIGNNLVPFLHCFDDAWQVLALFQDVVQVLATLNDGNVQPAEFCALLEACGFKDSTARNGSPEQIIKRSATLSKSLSDIGNMEDEDKQELCHEAKRYLAIEYSSGDAVWAMNGDTLEEITKAIEDSDTVCEEVTVFDLDTDEELTPVLRIDRYTTNKGRTLHPRG